ncbi:MARVEL domain-containing protein 3 [Engraulis encrasicolus]|uniref:MARVEL domain-containing protein 3 n=1 Tax=Engraulis encrasicolus TaxID=184585 RepID=UPI002FD50C7D
MSHPPRNYHGHRDQRGGREPRDHREGNARRDYYEDRPPPSDSASSQPPYYPNAEPAPRQRERQRQRPAPQEDSNVSKCTNICSRRGIVLICAVLTNALVLVCIVAAHLSMSGMSSAGMSGGFNINAQIPFQGTELQQVRDLDMQFSQMRAPGVYGGVAFSLTMGVISLLFVVSGTKPAYLLSRKLLVGQFVFQLVGGIGYVVAVGLYLHFVISVNATDVCQRRERLYAGRGYTWMNCDVGGGDAAVALFGLITALLYAAGTYFTFVTIRNVAHYHKQAHHSHRERDSNL